MMDDGGSDEEKLDKKEDQSLAGQVDGRLSAAAAAPGGGGRGSFLLIRLCRSQGFKHGSPLLQQLQLVAKVELEQRVGGEQEWVDRQQGAESVQAVLVEHAGCRLKDCRRCEV